MWPWMRSAPPVVVWQSHVSSDRRATTPSSMRNPSSLHMSP
jgi:hypothetical protein